MIDWPVCHILYIMKWSHFRNRLVPASEVALQSIYIDSIPEEFLISMLTDLKIAHGEILTRDPSWSKLASTINVLTINTLPFLHTSISTDTNISIQSAFNEKDWRNITIFNLFLNRKWVNMPNTCSTSIKSSLLMEWQMIDFLRAFPNIHVTHVCPQATSWTLLIKR